MCVLRIVGERLDAAAVVAMLQDGGLDARTHGAGRQVTCVVSERSWSDLGGQVADAEAFLSDFETLIRRLAARPDVEGLVLDFPTERKPELAAQFFRFPASLVAKAGGLGVALEVSAYDLYLDARGGAS